MRPSRRSTAARPRRRPDARPRYMPRSTRAPRVALIAGAAIVVVALIAGTALLRSMRPVTSTTTVELDVPTSVVLSATVDSSTPSQPPTTMASPATPASVAPDIPALQQDLFQLVNESRRAGSRPVVSWNTVAATAAQRHAEEMVRFGYASHWNLDGLGPDHRYTLAGGTEAVSETLLLDPLPAAAPASHEEWQWLIADAYARMLDDAARRAIALDPAQTHVGAGLAYDAGSNRLALVQLFTRRYVALQQPPRRARLGDTITVDGRLLSGATLPRMELAYELVSSPRTTADLASSTPYISTAEVYERADILPDADGGFSRAVLLDSNGRSGLYHIRIFVNTAFGEILATDAIVEVF